VKELGENTDVLLYSPEPIILRTFSEAKQEQGETTIESVKGRKIPRMTLPHPLNPSTTASYLLSVLSSSQNTPYIGEPVSQLSHSLQAAHLASSASNPPADDETIIAALLHDIGQFVPEDDIAALLATKEKIRDIESESLGSSVGRYAHDELGAQFLSALGFPRKVTTLVGQHVNAKRYLCGIDQGYYEGLSEASKESLRAQGGAMAEQERRGYEEKFGEEWVRDICRLRVWDDTGKEVGGPEGVGGVESFRGMMKAVLERARE
jgi:putative nucleotidyltransferase with HDIG domain